MADPPADWSTHASDASYLLRSQTRLMIRSVFVVESASPVWSPSSAFRLCSFYSSFHAFSAAFFSLPSMSNPYRIFVSYNCLHFNTLNAFSSRFQKTLENLQNSSSKTGNHADSLSSFLHFPYNNTSISKKRMIVDYYEIKKQTCNYSAKTSALIKN